jgi:hypothetical protein
MQQILSMSLGVDIAALFSLLPSLAALFNPQLHSEGILRSLSACSDIAEKTYDTLHRTGCIAENIA